MQPQFQHSEAEHVVSLDAPPVEATASAQAEAARSRAAQLMNERQYAEAKKALEEADTLDANADRIAKAEAARTRAAQLMTERKFAEARKALDEADAIEANSAPRRVISALRSQLQKLPKRSAAKEEAPEAAVSPETGAAAEPVKKSLEIVGLYSKIAAGAGLLPGGLLNFGAILAVQFTMVWKISKTFGHTDGKERIRGSILSLFGSALPTGIGHGAGVAIAAIPAVLAGTMVYFIATPILAYATTRAVGSAFIMHFESGGTLLTFDPKAFGDYFVKEFQKAGGTVKTDLSDSPAAVPA